MFMSRKNNVPVDANGRLSPVPVVIRMAMQP